MILEKMQRTIYLKNPKCPQNKSSPYSELVIKESWHIFFTFSQNYAIIM